MIQFIWDQNSNSQTLKSLVPSKVDLSLIAHMICLSATILCLQVSKGNLILIRFQVETPKRELRTISGEVCVRLWYDGRADSLSVTVVRAQDLPNRDENEQQVPPAVYAKIHLLPDRR